MQATPSAPRAGLEAGETQDGSIRIWKLGPRPRSQILTQEGATSALDFSPDGKTLATADDDPRVVALWDVGTGTRKRGLTGHTDTVTTVAFSPDGHTLASGGVDRTIALFDLTVPTVTAT